MRWRVHDVTYGGISESAIGLYLSGTFRRSTVSLGGKNHVLNKIKSALQVSGGFALILAGALL
jgi:hypothetical protein